MYFFSYQIQNLAVVEVHRSYQKELVELKLTFC